MPLPSVPAANVRQALVRATCDGRGLITVPTEDGPEHYACLGCRNCTSRAAVPAVRRDPFPPQVDDSPF